MYVYVCIYVLTCTAIHIYHVSTYAHTYIHTHIYIHAYTHTYTYNMYHLTAYKFTHTNSDNTHYASHA